MGGQKGFFCLPVRKNAIFYKIIFLVFSPRQKCIDHAVGNLETNGKLPKDQKCVGNKS